jgi:hypothetical protein
VIYLPLAAGLQTPTAFLPRYSGLFQDYQRLDRILSSDAALPMGYSATSPAQYAWYSRPRILYAPRPVLTTAAELRTNSPTYLLYIGKDEPEPTRGTKPIRAPCPAGRL